jgi:hypothetical protein
MALDENGEFEHPDYIHPNSIKFNVVRSSGTAKKKRKGASETLEIDTSTGNPTLLDENKYLPIETSLISKIHKQGNTMAKRTHILEGNISAKTIYRVYLFY